MGEFTDLSSTTPCAVGNGISKDERKIGGVPERI